MAKRRKAPSITQSRLLSITGKELGTLSRAELQQYATTANQLLATRVSRLQKAGLSDSPAVQALMRNVQGGHIARNVSNAMLISQIKGAQRFGRSELSTVTGYRELLRRSVDQLNAELNTHYVVNRKAITTGSISRKFGANVRLAYTKDGRLVATTKELNDAIPAGLASDLWDKYHELLDSGRLNQFVGGSPPAFQTFFDEYADDPNASPEDLLERMVEEYEMADTGYSPLFDDLTLY